ncbi:MAG: 2-hydroxychromene-2-carboxylate isomerase [Hyphomicrobiaceae bacterium]|jgi:2-hydroxychromene-2-carboxylate isomerase
MSETGGRIEFWYEFSSTYSYIAAMRIEALAEAAGVTIDWKPFLLGPIFQAQGWNTSPFNLYPAKGRYMVREMERLAEQHGVPFRMPAVFPQNSLLAARLALAGVDAGWIAAFTKAVYLAEFRDGLDISSKAVLEEILRGLQLDPVPIFARIAEPEIKERLKDQTDLAQESGIFGAPSFMVGEELFWGNDRMEQALELARRG